MSMYNAIFGENKDSDLILGMIGLTKGGVGRFRDVFISDGKIAVYTRNGGGNRECWYPEEGEKCRCPGCMIERVLPDHPNYLYDRDDDFDSTYATIYFSIPDQMLELASKLATKTFDPDKRWMDKLESMQNETAESLRQKYPVLMNVLEEITKAMDEGESKQIEI